MRVVHTKRPLPRVFRDHSEGGEIILERDIRICQSRLRVKLLVFPTKGALRRFWVRGLAHVDPGANCRGICTGLFKEVWKITPGGEKSDQRMEVDPRFYAVIGLIKTELYSDVFAHEAGHAAFCYARRLKGTPWEPHAKNFDEEAVCYPLGFIHAHIVQATEPLWRR